MDNKRTQNTAQNYTKTKPEKHPKTGSPNFAADALKFTRVYSYTILHPKTRQRALKCESIFIQL